MKRSLIAAFAFTAIANCANAQSNKARFIVKGGLNLANISTTNTGRVDDANYLTSFHAGFLGDIPIAGPLSFQPGLLVTGKGSKTNIYLDNNNTSANYYKLTTNPIYLEIPANFVFHVGNGSGLFFGAGPYAAMGIAGKTTGERNILGVVSSYDKTIEFNNDNPFTAGQEDASVNKLRKYDFGLNALAGFEGAKYLVGVNYGYGLSKIGSSEANENDRNKHRVLSISLGLKL